MLGISGLSSRKTCSLAKVFLRPSRDHWRCRQEPNLCTLPAFLTILWVAQSMFVLSAEKSRDRDLSRVEIIHPLQSLQSTSPYDCDFMSSILGFPGVSNVDNITHPESQLQDWWESDFRRKRSNSLVEPEELELETSNSKRCFLKATVDDLKVIVGFNAWNFKALCLLGTCYEKKGMLVDAWKAFEEALRVNLSSQEVKESVDRLS